MNIQNLKEMIDLLSSIESEPAEKSSELVGKKVIVRCRDAGVHFGELIGISGRNVTLKNTRRLWQWKSAKGHTLSGCAVHGIDHQNSKITSEVGIIELLEACEVIQCTDLAAESIGGTNEYQP